MALQAIQSWAWAMSKSPTIDVVSPEKCINMYHTMSRKHDQTISININQRHLSCDALCVLLSRHRKTTPWNCTSSPFDPQSHHLEGSALGDTAPRRSPARNVTSKSIRCERLWLGVYSNLFSIRICLLSLFFHVFFSFFQLFFLVDLLTFATAREDMYFVIASLQGSC